MSSIAFFGAVESGLLFGLVAFGVFIAFRVLDFPDLTVDGSFPLGAAVAATLIVTGWNPWLATAMAMVAGCMAGVVTAWLNVRLQILNLLASILTMIALYSINLRIMGKPNVALLGDETVFTPFENWDIPFYLINPIILSGFVLVVYLLFVRFMTSELGLAMRATGVNDKMARANGVHTGRLTILGVALANGMVGLAGALFAQSQGTADVTMGVGTIVIGLAAVIGGEAILSTRTIARWIFACLVGAILYRLAIAVALNADWIGLKAQDLNLITAVLVTLAIVIPRMKLLKRKGGRA
ncbi:ABC transporter permease [Oceanospirillum linum]|uniref:ABC transporter permease n=1 Tax=Oceanospirillum linum TaxID=966 RepID=UPI00089EEF1A|nr:ABC transporter permease [Oceanospirillum linum]SEF79340.1 putative ABC transport system permease protein [Oleiphilus messinensis]SMP18464.1 putative ABC transport system permease protein [Oceanospirillum linum]